MAKALPQSNLLSPKAELNKEVSFKMPVVSQGDGKMFGQTPDAIGKQGEAFPLKSSGKVSPKGPDARRSEKVGK